eukprot:Pgem_evm1s15108
MNYKITYWKLILADAFISAKAIENRIIKQCNHTMIEHQSINCPALRIGCFNE